MPTRGAADYREHRVHIALPGGRIIIKGGNNNDGGVNGDTDQSHNADDNHEAKRMTTHQQRHNPHAHGLCSSDKDNGGAAEGVKRQHHRSHHGNHQQHHRGE